MAITISPLREEDVDGAVTAIRKLNPSYILLYHFSRFKGLKDMPSKDRLKGWLVSCESAVLIHHMPTWEITNSVYIEEAFADDPYNRWVYSDREKVSFSSIMNVCSRLTSTS